MSERPGIIDRMKLALRVYRDGMPTRFKASPLAWPDFRQNTPQWHLVNLEAYLREGFEFNALIYSAIMYKAKAMSGAPLRAYSGTVDEPEMLPEEHPLSKLCARPNPSQSWREFQMLQTTWLNLTGNAFAYVDREGAMGDIPGALYPLNPLKTYIIPGPRGTIKGFVYKRENEALQEALPMVAADVIHTKLPNPGDPLDGQGYGMSPLMALGKSADVDNAITNFLKVFFDKGTAIGGLLKFNVPLDDPDIARIRTRWKEIYGGSENWDEIGILDQQGEYQRVGYSFDEMGFSDLDERNETRILAPFGVHPILIGSRTGLNHATLSNIEQAYKQFWQDTMLHEARLFEDDYQYYLSGDDAFVAFDFSEIPAFSQDTLTMIDGFVKLVEHGITASNAAEIVGLVLPEQDGLDMAYMTMSLVPVGMEAPEATTNETPVTAEEDTREELALQLFGIDGAEVKKNSPPRKRRHSGHQATALVGVGNASLRLARNAHFKKTDGSYSQD